MPVFLGGLKFVGGRKAERVHAKVVCPVQRGGRSLKSRSRGVVIVFIQQTGKYNRGKREVHGRIHVVRIYIDQPIAAIFGTIAGLPLIRSTDIPRKIFSSSEYIAPSKSKIQSGTDEVIALAREQGL